MPQPARQGVRSRYITSDIPHDTATFERIVSVGEAGISMSSSSGRRVGIVIGVIVLIGLAVLAWAAIRPGPLAFAGGKTVALNQYNGHPTGVPADFTGTDPLARGRYLTEAADCMACH